MTYYIINKKINKPLSHIDSMKNSRAMEFKSIDSANQYIERCNVPNKKDLEIMTWKQYLELNS